MKEFFKSKFATILILIATIVLAGVAIFTAYRLYSLRQQAVAPTAPTSVPKAQEIPSTPIACSLLTFTLVSPTATATITPTATPLVSPTATATITPTATNSPNVCGGTCGSNTNCADGLYCYQGFCKNPSCPTDADCICGTASSTITPAPTTTAQPELPDAGVSFPTILGISAGALLLILSFILAL